MRLPLTIKPSWRCLNLPARFCGRLYRVDILTLASLMTFRFNVGESVLQSSHTPTIVPEPSFPGWMRRSHTAQMMRKCLLYAPIQIMSCADCRLDCVVGNSTVARLRRRFDCERSRLVACAQNRAKIVFDCERQMIRQHIIDESCNTFTTFRARLDETSRTPTKGFHEIRSATLG